MSAGLKFWRDAVEGDVATEAVARLSSNPGYEDVLRRTVSGALAYFDTAPEINRTFRDVGTFGLGVLALHLDAHGGVTHRKLAELGSSSAILSTGRASAILAMMRVKGLIIREASRRPDGHVHYLPTANLIHFFNTRLKLELSALAHVEPALVLFLDDWDAPGMFRRFVGTFGARLARAQNRPIAELEPVQQIGTHRAGFFILCDLLARADRGSAFPPTDTFEINVSDIARRFDVARSQARRVIQQLEDSGFLARDAGTGEARFTTELHTLFKRYMTVLHIGLMACAYDAMQPKD
ncbi:MAG TPA: helix-turn-helix domain-containing protein [Rhizomicrobium sp.]|nr:helix-turn-helix domain-containing protein [Rhizomicrobium sp.]